MGEKERGREGERGREREREREREGEKERGEVARNDNDRPGLAMSLEVDLYYEWVISFG